MSESLGTIDNPIVLEWDHVFVFEKSNLPPMRHQDIVNMKHEAGKYNDLLSENYLLREENIRQRKIVDGLLLAVGKYV